jgi:hemin uptake protein HemP
MSTTNDRHDDLSQGASRTLTSSANDGGAHAPAPGRKFDRVQAPATLQVTSEELFAGAAEVHIEHHGATYRLKHTSLGKLILTK